MFLRLITDDRIDSLYECNIVHIRPSGEDKLIFALESNDNSGVNLEIDKTTKTEVYIMNNEGKTIETYRWS